MRKPDIFDEIIQSLKTGAQTGSDTSMDEETLRALFDPPVRKAAPQPPVPAPAPARPPVVSGVRPQVRPAPRQAAPTQNIRGVPPAYAPDIPEWESLRTECASCMKCGLGKTRTNMVFADGNPHAELMFIGEGPGADEDATGVPFVGRAGELLSRMIAAMTFDRKTETCIANIVKCRPPGNRNPADDEAAACMPYLKRQIAMVNPKVIVLLGAVPLLYLFNLKGIMKLRGRWLDYNGIPAMPTYHPAYLLRNPPAKKDAWADLQAVMAVFGRKPAPRR